MSSGDLGETRFRVYKEDQAFAQAPVNSGQWGTHAASLAAMVPMPSDSMRAWLAAMRASRSASYALVAAA